MGGWDSALAREYSIVSIELHPGVATLLCRAFLLGNQQAKKKVTITIIHCDFLKGDDGTIFTPGDPVGFILVFQCPTLYDQFQQPYQQGQRTKHLSVWATNASIGTIPPIKQSTLAQTMAQDEENLK